MKFLPIGIFLFLIILSLFFVNLDKQNNKNPTIIIENKTFLLDVAKSAREQEIGLAKYNKLPQNMAMLFPFSNYGYYSFWMKNMKFPIDIIYIKDDKIVDIFTNVPNPKSENEKLKIYVSKSKANYVLEINANLSKHYGFKIGSSVKINL